MSTTYNAWTDEKPKEVNIEQTSDKLENEIIDIPVIPCIEKSHNIKTNICQKNRKNSWDSELNRSERRNNNGCHYASTDFPSPHLKPLKTSPDIRFIKRKGFIVVSRNKQTVDQLN